MTYSRRKLCLLAAAALVPSALWAARPERQTERPSSPGPSAVQPQPTPGPVPTPQQESSPPAVDLAEPINVAAEAAMLWMAGEPLDDYLTGTANPPAPVVQGLADVASQPIAAERSGTVEVHLTLEVGDADQPRDHVEVEALVVPLDGQWQVDALEARR